MGGHYGGTAGREQSGRGPKPRPTKPAQSKVLTRSSSSALRHLLHGCFHLFHRRLVLVSSNRPLVAEGIGQFSVAIAPEHVSHRHLDSRSGLHRALKRRVHIVGINVQSHAGAASALRRQSAHLRKLIAQHQHGVADAQLGMHDFPVRSFHNTFFHGTECLLVELDCAGSIADSHIWSNGVVTLRYSFYGHNCSPRRESGATKFTPKSAPRLSNRDYRVSSEDSHAGLRGIRRIWFRRIWFRRI